jgi:hypothetical protein
MENVIYYVANSFMSFNFYIKLLINLIAGADTTELIQQIKRWICFKVKWKHYVAVQMSERGVYPVL